MKQKIKKLIVEIAGIDNKYSVTLLLLYGYIIFAMLLILFIYCSAIILAYFPQIHLERLNGLEINIICFVLLVISIWLTILFSDEAKEIQQWFNSVIVRLDEQLSSRILRLIFLILFFGALWGLNQILVQVSNGTINIITEKTINEFSKWSSILASLSGFLFQLMISNIPDLKVSFIYKHKLVTNYELKDKKDSDVLTVIATNKGKVKATYKFLGICTESERDGLYNNGLRSEIKQPKVYYRSEDKNVPLKMKTMILDQNKSCVYILKFDKFPENQKFFIVFLEMPNRLIFVPVYLQSKKNIPHHFIKWFRLPICLLICLLALKIPETKAVKKIYGTGIKTVIVNNKQYQILQNKNYSKSNTYSVSNTNLKIKQYQILKQVTNGKNIYKCYVELNTNKETNLYFNKCQMITREGRKFDVKLECFNNRCVGNTRIYQIVTKQLDINNFKDIEKIELGYLDTLNNKKGTVTLIVEK